MEKIDKRMIDKIVVQLPAGRFSEMKKILRSAQFSICP
ncbi:Uncharacterized protein dnm_092540 [Desulfonema magnum]|uniref:Uncharacterized protein n=1 Tax=Desulfonema magnum TaxID=45655 RepID=A0A975BXI7_9BACT|nr:Uncharacterized protein dnm_092540 [Desulfonema magnum]